MSDKLQIRVVLIHVLSFHEKYRQDGKSEFKKRKRGEESTELLLDSLDCLRICSRQGAFHTAMEILRGTAHAK